MKSVFTSKAISPLFLTLIMALMFWQAGSSQIIIPPIIKIYPPSISTQPVTKEFCQTSTASYASFTVTAKNTSSYQWQYWTFKLVYIGGRPTFQYYWRNFTDGSYLSGSTTSNLRIYKPSGGWTPSSNKTIRVVCTGLITPNATSATVYLRVHNLPTITTQPASATVWNGVSHTLSVTATSAFVPSYQWQKWMRPKGSFIYTWTNLSGATSKTYSTTSSGSYRVRITDSYCGSVYSGTAVITRNGVTGISSNISECSDYTGNASFTVYATNPTGYQWWERKGTFWVAISGAKSSSYTKTKPASGWTASDNAQYKCVVAFALGTQTSGVATLTITEAPNITNHPGNTTKNEGESVTLSVVASGATAFQWQKFIITDWEDIIGANSAAYNISSVLPEDAGNYRCITSNDCGETISNSATLSVNPDIGEDAWYAQDSESSKHLRDVSFPGLNEGWTITTETDQLLHTLNGGATWLDVFMKQSDGTTPLNWWNMYSIEFRTTSIGYVTGYNGYAYTDDGGATWSTRNLQSEMGLSTYFYARNTFFLDANNGWLVGDDGVIAKTTNGGVNWTKVAYSKDGSKVTDAILYEVFFTHVDTGYVAGASGEIWRTYDGGVNWVDVSAARNNEIQDIHFVSGKKGFAVDYETRKIMTTTNGGDTWTDYEIPGNTYMSFYGIEFADAENGWAIGRIQLYIDGSWEIYGMVYRTNDGGDTWHQQDMQTGIDEVLYGLAVYDAENAWATGNYGVIQRTATGGCLIPTMNLGADQAICEGESVTLVADTFAQNLNCSYEWQDATAGGSYIAMTAGTYSVTATSLCGVTATDEMILSVNDLPPADAGEDQEICYGDTVQLNASGGTSYLWSSKAEDGKIVIPPIIRPPLKPTKSAEAGGVYISDPEISNPLVTANPGTTSFIVTVEDLNGCQQKDTVDLIVYQVPNTVVSAAANVCREEATSVVYTGNASGAADYYWDFGDGVAVEISPNNWSVTWDTTGEQTITLAVNENGCFSDTAWIPVNVSPIPNSNFLMTSAVCDSGLVEIIYDGVDSVGATYTWDFNGGDIVNGGTAEGPYQLKWMTEGIKTISLQVNQEGCISDLTVKDIDVNYTYAGAEICLVTIDEQTGKYMVIWEKPENVGIESFNVYRQTSELNVFELLANVPFDALSVYTDMTSEPEKKQHVYKISAVDSCGESAMSLYHKTMLLQFDADDGNLNWTEYELESGDIGFIKYIIYRGADSTQLAAIDSVAGGSTLYNDDDPDASAGKRWYRVAGVKPEYCYPSVKVGGLKAGTGPYNHSLSNMDDNKLKVGVEDVLSAENTLRVYPNPFKDEVRIEYFLNRTAEVKIEVYNILGVRILELEDNNQIPGVYRYDLRADELDGSSLYYLRFTEGNRSYVRKLIPAK